MDSFRGAFALEWRALVVFVGLTSLEPTTTRFTGKGHPDPALAIRWNVNVTRMFHNHSACHRIHGGRFGR